ncbi:MAG TPA: sugar phosphate nucleotidyltransferase [Candidatus Syntrophosphaera sp.]|jgi:NDP-sugar pyrophosphorylase family protein|nr:sugar phosphate nucleotidyltransferase [Candidatus Cloacimonadota bacterium]HQO67718.1 sugar phosphate nucleotidyltransferase [Candidatus Syntrophosphaera sp.]
MKAVILSGGLGTRLKPFTEVIPKPLLPIGEKAVLEVQIERLRDHGFDTIILATNYKSEYIENFFGDGSRYGIDLKVSREDSPLGTAGPLSLLKKELQDPFLVMNGDILTLLNFRAMYEYAINLRAPMTIGIKKEILPFAFGNIFFEGDYVTDIQEKPNFELYILAGIYVFTHEIFKYIPDYRQYDMDQLIKRLLSENVPIPKYHIEEYWLDIGRIGDYEKAQVAYETHFKNGDNE